MHIGPIWIPLGIWLTVSARVPLMRFAPHWPHVVGGGWIIPLSYARGVLQRLLHSPMGRRCMLFVSYCVECWRTLGKGGFVKAATSL